jgi:hypothetical protein
VRVKTPNCGIRPLPDLEFAGEVSEAKAGQRHSPIGKLSQNIENPSQSNGNPIPISSTAIVLVFVLVQTVI